MATRCTLERLPRCIKLIRDVSQMSPKKVLRKNIRCLQFRFLTTMPPGNNASGNILDRQREELRHSEQTQAEAPPRETSGTTKSAEDILFDLSAAEDGKVHVGRFLAALKESGVRPTDVRLSELHKNIRTIFDQQEHENVVTSVENVKLDRDQFKSVIADNIVLISRAFLRQFVIPEFEEFCSRIEKIYNKCKGIHLGKVASYIPQLERMSPDYWGVSLCTIDGQRFSVGDTKIPFTMQSCSKPLTYAIALNELGSEVVHRYVGQEPSGRMFNELVLDFNKRPHNPLINSGALVTTSLILSLLEEYPSLADKYQFVNDFLQRLSGNEYIGFNNAVFLSERENADRNNALAYYMRENKCFPEKINLRDCLDFYFQCCSMEADCESMSVMASTLANGGICPITGDQVLKPDAVRDVLSLMHSCGMYDYSGQFAFSVGLPAKSGVCGGMLVVIPNVMGLCLWSPPLDALSNSVRGIEFCRELVNIFNFHRYDNLKHAPNKLDPRRHKYEPKGLSIATLLFAAASGDITAMRRYLLSGLDMSLSDYDNRTALHVSAAEGHLECVQFLLRHCNISPEPKDRWNRTPLDDATQFGHQPVAEFLQEFIAKQKMEQQNQGVAADDNEEPASA
ncbi:hypothetical protein QYM36_006171 [Artemia franciscana]|uniref:glutaminase n=1 Tax=Artemia franciscana TaxID=6661 RepID=A0AA88L3A8_ARTSF|nr:hypothetical protein QYM36_006171 [Artemia franciscana]